MKKININLITQTTIKILMSLLLILVVSLRVNAGVGTTSAEFLLISNGARPSSMSGSFTGVADDVHTIGYNPAGLAGIDNRQVSFMHSEWLMDTNYEFGAFVLPVKTGSLGFSVIYFDAGDMAGRGNMGQITNEFTATDLAATIGYGFKVSPEVSVGFSGKFINQKIDNASRAGGAVDVGMLWEVIPEKMFYGAAINNAGPKLPAFDSEEDTLPTCYRMGVGYYALEEKLLMASDVRAVTHGEPTWSAGFEYLLRTILFLRSGVSAGSELDNSLAWTGGIGFSLGNYYLDYCFEPFGELDSTHKISLVMKF